VPWLPGLDSVVSLIPRPARFMISEFEIEQFGLVEL